MLTTKQLVKVVADVYPRHNRKVPKPDIKLKALSCADFQLFHVDGVDYMEYKCDEDARSSLNSEHLASQVQRMNSEPIPPGCDKKRLALVVTLSDRYLLNIGPQQAVILTKRLYGLKKEFPAVMIFICLESHTAKSDRSAVDVGMEKWLLWVVEPDRFEKDGIREVPIMERQFKKGPIFMLAAGVDRITEQKALWLVQEFGCVANVATASQPAIQIALEKHNVPTAYADSCDLYEAFRADAEVGGE